MWVMNYISQLRTLIILLAAGGAFAPAWAAPPSTSPQDHSTPAVDRSGRERVGTASFYAQSFSGKKMADGTPMRPQENNAASRTLPLGTTAMVTNLKTGKHAIITIRDRGPYVKGRIVDLSPSTARKIGITRTEGLAKVEVAPLEVPLPGAIIKPGVSDAEAKKKDQRIASLAEQQRTPSCHRYLIDYGACL